MPWAVAPLVLRTTKAVKLMTVGVSLWSMRLKIRWTVAESNDVYIGLGGNIGNTSSILRSAIRSLATLPEVADLKLSHFYKTSPISDLEQSPYVNAVCKFKTTLSASHLLEKLQQIEKEHGKCPKPKNAPRTLDLDILFYGSEYHDTVELEIPHPRWRERLFVLIPLADLCSSLIIPHPQNSQQKQRVDVRELIHTFSHPVFQSVSRLDEISFIGNEYDPSY